MKLSLTRQNGISTLEMMIAMALIVLSISAVMLLVFGSQSTSVDSNTNNQALYIAQQQLENIRASARADFTTVQSSPMVAIAGTNYSKQITVTSITDPSTGDVLSKDVLVDISWQEGTRSLHTKLTTRVADWSSALSGDTCHVPLTSDWSSPRVLNTSKIVLPTNNQSTGVVVKGSYAYMTASAQDGTNGAGHNFYVIDVSSTKTPFLVGVGLTGYELDGVYVFGDYAYVMGFNHGSDPGEQRGAIYYQNGYAYLGFKAGLKTTDHGQFYIINIHDPNNPFVVSGSTFNFPDDLSTAHKNDEFVILNVQNPGSPTFVSGLSDANAKAAGYGFGAAGLNAISIFAENKVFVATEDASNGLVVIDVSNKTNPTFKGSYSGLGSHAYGLFVSKPSRVLLAGNNKALHYLDADTHLPTIDDLDHSPPIINDRVGGIMASGKYAFLATHDSSYVFQVFDISKPASISTRISSLPNSTYPFLSGASSPAGGLACKDNVVYLALDDYRDSLKIIGPAPIAAVATEIHNSSEDIVVSVIANTSFHDKATVTGNGSVAPTGTVTFTFYTNNTCSKGATPAGIITLDSSGIAHPSTAFAKPKGNYSFIATYNGDTNYNSATSTCSPLTVN